jgi:hypothetical protein
MSVKYTQSEKILIYLRDNHTGAENFVPSPVIEKYFGIKGVELRALINKLRCESQPVCSDGNGYYYARTVSEIDDTIAQLLSRIRKIDNAAQGLIRSREIFQDGTKDDL